MLLVISRFPLRLYKRGHFSFLLFSGTSLRYFAVSLRRLFGFFSAIGNRKENMEIGPRFLGFICIATSCRSTLLKLHRCCSLSFKYHVSGCRAACQVVEGLKERRTGHFMFQVLSVWLKSVCLCLFVCLSQSVYL